MVNNHRGPIRFNVERSGARPGPHREGPGNMREHIASMAEEPESVAMKRMVLPRKDTIQFSDNSNDNMPLMQGRTNSYFPSPEPGNGSISSNSNRDTEPTLLHNFIAVQGYINHGTLLWDDTAQKWTLELEHDRDTVNEAFPGTALYADKDVAAFLTLALSQTVTAIKVCH